MLTMKKLNKFRNATIEHANGHRKQGGEEM
jgi:hypothetical protein